jgi:integrase/recombinase XerD
MTTAPCWARVSGPLAPYAQGFRAELERQGYTPLSAAVQIRLMSHLDRWLSREGLDIAGLTPARVEAYFAERRAGGYVGERTVRALRPLVGYLQRLEVLPVFPAPAPATPVDQLLARYRHYLIVERGLSENTVDLNLRLVGPFLRERADGRAGRLDLGVLTAAEVNAFVVTASRYRPCSVKRTVSALRSLLVFLHVAGLLDRPLAAAVLSPPGWTQTGLPKALSDDQVAALLTSCDRAAPPGRRDFVILTLLARLGLRVGEVAALTLEDIDWRRGELTVHGKGNRRDRLPLPADVGEPIVDYLRHGRPAVALDRAVFLRMQAPYRGLTSVGVSTLVEVAGRRAGLGTIGAHRLRHFAATAMLRRGGSLTEIGQTLRHIRPATTAIYAKVDERALRTLAKPWPIDTRGGAS